MEEITEVITSSVFHPQHCNLFMYSSSKGTIRLVDTRQSTPCDKNAKIFEDTECNNDRSFFTEIVASISDARCVPSKSILMQFFLSFVNCAFIKQFHP